MIHVNYGRATAVQETVEWVDYPRREEEDAPRERSAPMEDAEEEKASEREDTSYVVAEKP